MLHHPTPKGDLGILEVLQVQKALPFEPCTFIHINKLLKWLCKILPSPYEEGAQRVSLAKGIEP